MHTQDHITTEAEEMYLITIARAIEDGAEPPVAVSVVAKDLGVSSVSANQMVKKLEQFGLVEYTPYKGVSLTLEGEILAQTVLRNRRLWGFFLSEHLGLEPERADEVACEMEHITPEFVADRLSAFLGDPHFGPTGKPIPRFDTADSIPLADVATGRTVTVVSIAAPYDSFLASQGAERGAKVSVVATATDGSVILETPNGPVNLAPSAAAAVTVK